jgi:hypothetical protein
LLESLEREKILAGYAAAGVTSFWMVFGSAPVIYESIK